MSKNTISTDSASEDISLRADLTLSTTSGADANGVATNVITARVSQAGSLLSGINITFLITSGTGASFSDGSTVYTGTTNILGTCTVPVTSIRTGEVTVLATCYVGGVTSSGSVTMVFGEVEGGDDKNLQLHGQVIRDEAVNDGLSVNTVRFTLLNDQNKPVANKELRFGLSGGSAQLSTVTAITDAAGQAQVNVTSTAVGSVDITATLVEDATITATASVTFIKTEYSLSYNILRNGVEADGESVNYISFTLTNQSGGAVAGQTINFVVQSASGNAILRSRSEITDHNGLVVAYVANTTPEAVSLVATLQDDAQVKISAPLFFTEVAVVPDPVKYVLSGTITKNDSYASNMEMSGRYNTVLFTLLRNGEPAVGEVINFTSQSSHLFLTQTSAVTDERGQCEVSCRADYAIYRSGSIYTIIAARKSGGTSCIVENIKFLYAQFFSASLKTSGDIPADGKSYHEVYIKLAHSDNNDVFSIVSLEYKSSSSTAKIGDSVISSNIGGSRLPAGASHTIYIRNTVKETVTLTINNTDGVVAGRAPSVKLNMKFG
ncbi:hypothetical protein F3J29_12750 [Enterobacter sp. Cy-643]|uniref:Ig-like domain-containing protein n=1 Tax=Enterobacter sp. Cy-643 TaxID=2608346 RepID=UPI00141DFA38|nr:Ig-like domain-containing protein [Enterobacter sp. Cy-643]NIF32999.1 hypothetical protein [Enterobacter sp. Cy-643]